MTGPLAAITNCGITKPPACSCARIVASILAFFVVAFGLAMTMQIKHYDFGCAFHHHISGPVLAMELAGGTDDLVTALGEAPAVERRAALRANTTEDCVFILLYTSFLWAFARLFAVKRDGTPINLRLFTGVVVATALCDYAENFGILRALNAPVLTDCLAQHISWPSRCKWTLFGLALILTATILARSSSDGYTKLECRLIAIAYAIIGALLVLGPWYPRLIELAVPAFAGITIVNLFGLSVPLLLHSKRTIAAK
jgi:hypothetical protein